VSLEVRRGRLTEVSQRNVDHSRPPGY
jgi:hypothetical protein